MARRGTSLAKYFGQTYFNIRSQNSYMIFVLFSPQTQFLDKFFSTQKRVNRNKKFLTKQRKSSKNWFYNSLMQQNTINCTHNFSKLEILFRFLMWRAFSTWQSVTWRILPHDNLSCGECGARDKYQVCQNSLNLPSSSNGNIGKVPAWNIWMYSLQENVVLHG